MVDRPALEALAVSKRYGDRDALSGVDLIARPGRLHGLLGPNGAGKTTLLRVLLGLVRRDAGTVRLLGCDRDSTAGFDTRRGRRLRGHPRVLSLPVRTPEPRAARPSRRRCGIGPARQSRSTPSSRSASPRTRTIAVAGYSAGMRQRLGLAAALLRAPRLLFLDEPTSSLDPARRARRARPRPTSGGRRRCRRVEQPRHGRSRGALRRAHGHRPRPGRLLRHGRRTAEARARRRSRAAHERRPRRTRPGLAAARCEGEVASATDGGLEVSADVEALDAYVIALGCAGVAVRVLERRARSLESLFLELTGRAGRRGGDRTRRRATLSDGAARFGGCLMSVRGVLAVAGVECSKLAAQLKARVVLAACVVGPFAFAVACACRAACRRTRLFGRSVKESGFAVPLVVLGFAALWVFPVLTSIVGGDLFSAEDRYGTWTTVLTRSRSRGEVFAGKVLTALGFSSLAVAALAVSSVAAGVLSSGRNR